MTFRKDINGLRAIAVLSVLIFHFEPELVPGGFIGVDVFFVISGFLMTAIITSKLDKGDFSIFEFYYNRANRIIPAMVVLCVVLLIFGWLYLGPEDYKNLAKHAFSSVAFFSNFTYLSEAGYFDAASLEKWLLHTWSLSIEWQFYIIYPLLLIFLRRYFYTRYFKPIILLLAAISLIFSIIISPILPSSSYYLLSTRVWELLFGGLAYLYPIRVSGHLRKYIEWLGVSLILIACVMISESNIWPGYLALIPTFGAYCIIQASREGSIITGNYIFQKVGAWSYSIYLWHWPIVVAIYYYSLDNLYILLGIALSVLLGFLSYTYVESIKFQKYKKIQDIFKLKPLWLAFAASTFSILIFFSNGFLSRYSSIDGLSELTQARQQSELYYRTNLMSAFSNNGDVSKNSQLCTLDGGYQTSDSAIQCLSEKIGEEGYLVLGDSHGRDFYHALKKAYPDVNFAMLHQSSCVPTQYYADTYCFDILDDIINGFVKSSPKVRGIYISSKYKHIEGVQSLLLDLADKKYGALPIYLVNATPRLKKTVVGLAIEQDKVTDVYKLDNRENIDVIRINKMLSGAKNVEVIDKYSAFCDKNNNCRLVKDKLPLFWDKGHLTQKGIEELAKAILQRELSK